MSGPALCYLLDEDVHPRAAAVARGLGLDVVSVHEVDRRGYGDAAQLAYAAGAQRIFVTRNRDDFISLTVAAYRVGDPHAGVLILPHTLPNRRPARIARALKRWHDRQTPHGHPGAYFLDFLG